MLSCYPQGCEDEYTMANTEETSPGASKTQASSWTGATKRDQKQESRSQRRSARPSAATLWRGAGSYQLRFTSAKSCLVLDPPGSYMGPDFLSRLRSWP